MPIGSELAHLHRKVVACARCPRLVAYRNEAAQLKKRQFQHDTYWGKPVPGFGDPNARLLIVGLAPAPHGSNRTGRMFTGDGTDGNGSSDFLMRALHATGFANQPTSQHRGDGLKLLDAYMTAIARCAPPGNKPTPAEIAECAPFLHQEMELLSKVRATVALGKLAFDQLFKAFSERGAAPSNHRPRFAHGVQIRFGQDRPMLIASYHPSRQNTQTGLLTPKMLQNVFAEAKYIISSKI